MRLAVILLVLFAALPGAAETYYGKVVGITDDDTLTLLTPEKRQIKVRLAEIDTPERGQPWGTRAKQALSDLVLGKEARVVYVDTDRYGRMAGRVYVGDTDVNAELIKGGHAWVYRQYVTDESLYAIENEARNNIRGLWSLPETQHVPPWKWRSGTRSVRKSKPPSTLTADEAKAFTCGTNLRYHVLSGRLNGSMKCPSTATCSAAGCFSCIIFLTASSFSLGV